MKIHPKFAAVLKRQQEKQAEICERINKRNKAAQALERPEYRAELAEKVIRSGVLRHE